MDSLSALHLVVIFIRNWLLFQDEVRFKLQVFSATLYNFFRASSTKHAFLSSSFTLSMWQGMLWKLQYMFTVRKEEEVVNEE